VRLITKWFGVFLAYGDEVKDSRLFPNDSEEIANRLLRIRNGEVLEEEKELTESVENVLVGERRLSSLGRFKPEKRITEIKPEQFGFERDTLHEALLILGRQMVLARQSVSDDIIQTVSAIDETIDALNTLSTRLREWYGYHDPFGEQDEKEVYGNNTALHTLKKSVDELEASRASLEKELRALMEERAPNLSKLVGPSIGARLISMAGGLKRLSTMPSSTIQVLGAENAFFKYLKDGKGLPKHGIIYQHPLVHRAKPRDRGKISRFMAGKIRIAAAVDANGGEYIGDELLKAVEERAKELRERPEKKKPTKKDKKSKKRKKNRK
jgi:nucleolar protein 56